MLLQAPAPAPLLARTFQVRATSVGNAVLHSHQGLLRPVFLSSSVPASETRSSYFEALRALLQMKVGVVVAMVPLGASAVGLPGLAPLPGPSWPAARAVPASSRAARSANTSVVVSARSERPGVLLLMVRIASSFVAVGRDVLRVSRGQRRRATVAPARRDTGQTDPPASCDLPSVSLHALSRK